MKSLLELAVGVWDRARQTSAGISLVTIVLGAVLLLTPTTLDKYGLPTDTWIKVVLCVAGTLVILYGLIGLLAANLPQSRDAATTGSRSDSTESEPDNVDQDKVDHSLIKDGREALSANPVEVSNIEEFLTAIVAHRHRRHLAEIGRDPESVVRELGQDFWVTFHLADVNSRSLRLYAASWNARGRAELENMEIPFGISAVGTAASDAEHWIRHKGKLPGSTHVTSTALTHPLGTYEGLSLTQGATECLCAPVVPWMRKSNVELTLDGDAQGKYLLGILTYWNRSETTDVLSGASCRVRHQKTAGFVGALLHLNLGEEYIEDNAELFAVPIANTNRALQLPRVKPSKPEEVTQEEESTEQSKTQSKKGSSPEVGRGAKS